MSVKDIFVIHAGQRGPEGGRLEQKERSAWHLIFFFFSLRIVSVNDSNTALSASSLLATLNLACNLL